MAFDIAEHPHRRKNPLTDQWVLVSPHRSKRPWQGQVEAPQRDILPAYDSSCYLCPRNSRAGGQVNPDYTSTYVFTNDFSALLPDTPKGEEKDLFYQVKSVGGICKVLIFSPDHGLTLPRMAPADIKAVVVMWQHEYLSLASHPNVNYVQIFENKGLLMGCSNPHPHGQIWATESIPEIILKKAQTQGDYYRQNGGNMLVDYGNKELEKGIRIIYANEDFVVLVPFWAVWPFEAMILPREQSTSIASFTSRQCEALADALRVVTTKYDNLFECSFPYSAGMHQIPCDGNAWEGFTWHMLFYPPLLRSAQVRKFMVGYEMLAEPQRDLTPEQCAAMLREQSDIHYRK